jgi:hypothetical protein
MFLDQVHLRGEGNAVIAARLFDALLADAEITASIAAARAATGLPRCPAAR